ncbi:hypothetical protein EK904_011058 [Melospiza melodia maxima]|nr:hypothetical protein EK904_011058 [Melospiza melodia maxima]
MSIRGSSSAIATVTFTPPDKQSYDCTFKASLVIPKGSVEVQPQILTFTISGKGQELPVTVVRPNARSKRGTAVLRFKRLQLEHSEMLPLVLRNSGTKPVKFMLQLEDEHGAFSLKGRAFTFKTVLTGEMEEDSVRNGSGSLEQIPLVNGPEWIGKRLVGGRVVGPVKIKPQTVTFTISGQAHEAQLTVVCPSARSKRGAAVLRFKRRRVGTSQKLPLVVRNDGIIPLKFMLCLEHEYGAFFLKGRASTLEIFRTEDEDSIINGKFITHEM